MHKKSGAWDDLQGRSSSSQQPASKWQATHISQSVSRSTDRINCTYHLLKPHSFREERY